MSRFFAVLAVLVGFLVLIAPAQAKVRAQISLSKQVMVVKVNGKVAHVWRVSTAKRGMVTPRGTYAPKRMYVRYFSKKYYNSPMPYSIFFRGGYAVHGTDAVHKLGQPASHGCVRLHTANAAKLFKLVMQHGPRNTRIIISG
jgi:lipoprotein-anchoring transpeptidase ErfK/SrfK